MTDYDPIQKLVLSGISNIYDEITDLRDFYSSCGWTILDDQTSATDKYFVVKSSDDVTDYRESPCYVGFKVFSAQKYLLRVCLFLHWDEVAHTPTGIRRTYTNYSFWTDSNIYRDYYRPETLKFSTVANDNNLTMYGNKYFVNFLLYCDNINKYYGVNVFKFMDTKYDYKFLTLSGATKGISRSLQLEDNQVNRINLGDSMWLLDKDSHLFNKVVVNRIDTANSAIVANELYRTTVSGSWLGPSMHIYPWVVQIDDDCDTYYGESYFYRTFHCFNNASVNSYYGTGTYYSGGVSSSLTWFPKSTSTSYLYNVGYRKCIDDMIFYIPDEIFGSNDYLKKGPGANRDTIGYNRQYIGTATSGTIDTLMDVSCSWVDDSLVDKCVIITDGPAAGDALHVISNTSNSVTISGAFSEIPTSTTQYNVYDEAYIKVDNNERGSYTYLMRIA